MNYLYLSGANLNFFHLNNITKLATPNKTFEKLTLFRICSDDEPQEHFGPRGFHFQESGRGSERARSGERRRMLHIPVQQRNGVDGSCDIVHLVPRHIGHLDRGDIRAPTMAKFAGKKRSSSQRLV